MQKLFFELLQVSLGRLDCVDRAPLEEEWPLLYRMAHEQEVVATSYQGVEKLFEFGLRGPQDLMLDWMSEAETAFDADVIEDYEPQAMKNPLKNSSWHTIQEENQQIASSATMHFLSLVVMCHEQFVHGHLKLRPLLDGYRLLHQIDGHFEQFANGRPFDRQLKSIGLLHFAQGLMWVMQETMKLEQRLMPCKPLESEGRFILSDIMGEAKGWKYWLKKHL